MKIILLILKTMKIDSKDEDMENILYLVESTNLEKNRNRFIDIFRIL